jgi:hypothetical protein
MNDPAPSTSPPHRSRRRLILWFVFLIASILFGVGRVMYERQWRALRLQYQARVGAESWQWSTLEWRLRGYIAEFRNKSPQYVEAFLALPQGQLSRAWSPGRQVADINGADVRLATPWNKRLRSRLFHPDREREKPALAIDLTGWRIQLVFYDGKFVNGTITQPMNPTIPAPNPTLHHAFDYTASALLFLTPFIWLGATLADATPRRPRTHFAEVALAAVLAGAIAWATSPDLFRTRASGIVLALAAVLMLISVRMILKRRRLARKHELNRCLQCNYDLTGNESGICPECGTATEASHHQAAAARAQAAADAVSGMLTGHEPGSA